VLLESAPASALSGKNPTNRARHSPVEGTTPGIAGAARPVPPSGSQPNNVRCDMDIDMDIACPELPGRRAEVSTGVKGSRTAAGKHRNLETDPFRSPSAIQF